MEANPKSFGLGLTIGALGAVAALGLVGLAVVYTGSINVAATEEHAAEPGSFSIP